MKSSLALKSIGLFGLSVILLILLTSFEALLLGLSNRVERVISLILLVLPGLLGVYLGVSSLRRKEGQTGLAILGVLLNGLFALFQFFVISFAG